MASYNFLRHFCGKFKKMDPTKSWMALNITTYFWLLKKLLQEWIKLTNILFSLKNDALKRMKIIWYWVNQILVLCTTRLNDRPSKIPRLMTKHHRLQDEPRKDDEYQLVFEKSQSVYPAREGNGPKLTVCYTDMRRKITCFKLCTTA